MTRNGQQTSGKYTGIGLLTFVTCCFWRIVEAAAEDPAHFDQLVIRIMYYVKDKVNGRGIRCIWFALQSNVTVNPMQKMTFDAYLGNDPPDTVRCNTLPIHTEDGMGKTVMLSVFPSFEGGSNFAHKSSPQSDRGFPGGGISI